MLPKPQRDMPTVYGVTPSYIPIGNLRLAAGRFFDDGEDERAAPVAVLGEGRRRHSSVRTKPSGSTSRSTSNGCG